MENSMVFSTVGALEVLLALPEPKKDLMGSYKWSIPETPGVKVTSRGTFPNPQPTAQFETIHVYNVELTTMHAVQPFTQVQGGVHPPHALLFGKVGMISHPVSRTVAVSCSLPANSEIPMMIAVVNQAGSTGYHWESHGTGPGLKVSSHTYPNTSQLVGAPATEIFFVRATEPGTFHVQIEQFAPSSKVPVSSFVLAYTAY
jgi:hypothetical protein